MIAKLVTIAAAHVEFFAGLGAGGAFFYMVGIMTGWNYGRAKLVEQLNMACDCAVRSRAQMTCSRCGLFIDAGDLLCPLDVE